MILMSDFNYTNFDDVHVNMNNLDVSIEPIISDYVTVSTHMDVLDAAGLNSFDEMFPMLDFSGVKIKTPAVANAAKTKTPTSLNWINLYLLL